MAVSSIIAPRTLDTLTNIPLGPHGLGVPDLTPTGMGVAAALEKVMMTALARPPCVVSFSGGRDSSAVLAVAADVARRNRLDPPIPAILRFPGSEETDETAWQRIVLAHLKLQPKIITIADELDALGPYAQTMLLEQGLTWPGNAYMHLPIFEVATGGTVLTGVGGDELFEVGHRRTAMRQAVYNGLPSAARRVVWMRRSAPAGYGWLTDEGRRSAFRALARDETSWPEQWGPSLRHWLTMRSFLALDRGLTPLASRHDTRVLHPLLDRTVLAELFAVVGPGFSTRADGTRVIVRDLLPSSVIERRGKAIFDAPLWGPWSRSFTEKWSQGGLDQKLVDVARLRHEWRSDRPDFRTILLLHRAWLHDHG